MNYKKGLLIFLSSVAGLLLLAIIYFFNEDKFYTEYWLQKRIDQLQSASTPTASIDSVKLIRYKFYNDPSIDVSIEINNIGQLVIHRHSWFKNADNIKSYNFQIDKSAHEQLSNKFKSKWKNSRTLDADNKLGGTYYLLELVEAGQQTQIDYYNVSPDDNFIDFKDEIIEFAKRTLESNRR